MLAFLNMFLLSSDISYIYVCTAFTELFDCINSQIFSTDESFDLEVLKGVKQ